MSIKVIKVDGLDIRAMIQVDPRLGHILMGNVAAAVLEQLEFTQKFT